MVKGYLPCLHLALFFFIFRNVLEKVGHGFFKKYTFLVFTGKDRKK
jgi:hypothetical protein